MLVTAHPTVHPLRWLFSVDLRSLALVRVLIGAILLFDLMIRGADFVTWLKATVYCLVRHASSARSVLINWLVQ